MVCFVLTPLLAVALILAAARGWLHVSSPLPSCAAAQISTPAGREGKCARISGLFSTTTYNVARYVGQIRLWK